MSADYNNYLIDFKLPKRISTVKISIRYILHHSTIISTPHIIGATKKNFSKIEFLPRYLSGMGFQKIDISIK